MGLYVMLTLLGFVAGAATASTGIGWGLITVPGLLLLLRFPPKEAVALSVLGSVGYLLSLGGHRSWGGGIPWMAWLALSLGGFAGGLVGAATVDLLPDLTVKRLIGGMTVIAGLALLFPWES